MVSVGLTRRRSESSGRQRCVGHEHHHFAALTDWRTELRRVWTSFLVALTIAGCSGGGELSLTEYVERLNTIVAQARQEYGVLVASPSGGVLVADGAQLADFTPQDLQTALDQVREIEAKVDAATAAIDPPDQVATLHHLFFDFDGEFISAQEELAVRAGTAASWEELSNSAEMAAYRTALANDKQACIEAQSEVNTIGEQRERFADTPWMPTELKELFSVALGCDGYPEHPEDVYRPVPT